VPKIANKFYMKKIIFYCIIFWLFLQTFAWSQDTSSNDIINTTQQLQEIFVKAKNIVANQLGILVKTHVCVQLVSAEKLDELTGKDNPYTGNTVGACSQGVNITTISIMEGRATDEVTATLAHEYAHAWQHENCPRQAPVLLEGFARWVEYKVLKFEGFDLLAENYLNTRDPWYGLGLRKMLELEDKVGVKGCIEYMKTHADFDF
jgi:hypothetical protein